MDVCVCVRLFCVCVFLCVGRGLATCWSLVQGVLQSVNKITKLNKGQGPTKGRTVIKEEEEEEEEDIYISGSQQLTPSYRGPNYIYSLQDLRFPQRWLWTVLSCGVQRRVVRWKSTDISAEHVASIFGVEE
jgi:hypothetical protein